YDEPDDVSHRLPSASLTYQSKLPTSNSWPSRAVAFTWMIRNWPLAGGSEYSDSGSVVVSTFSTVIVPVSTPSSVTVPVSPTANVSGPVSSGSEMGSGSAMDDGIASGSSGVLSYGESSPGVCIGSASLVATASAVAAAGSSLDDSPTPRPA